MGCDAGGNRYYENRVDYPLGQHRWVEPGDIHNFDSSHVPPEWHSWMTGVNDATPTTEQEYIEEKMKHVKKAEHSDAPYQDNLGHQEPFFNFHHMHDQSQIRSRGYQIGNPIVGLPPGAPDGYYTQPGSPYNPASIRPLEFIGDLDEDLGTGGPGRPYKSEMWKERLKTAEEKLAEKQAQENEWAKPFEAAKKTKRLSARERAIIARGGTVAGAS